MLAADERLTTSQVARLAGVSEQALRNWLRAGMVASTETSLGRLVHARSLGEVVAVREAARRPRDQEGA